MPRQPAIVLGGHVLGVVPGLHALGWALIRCAPEEDIVEAVGVERTRQRRGLDGAHDHADFARRSRELGGLVRIIAEREPLQALVRVVPTRELSPEDARVWGLLDMLGIELAVPVIDVSRAAVDVGPDLEAEAALEGWLEDDEADADEGIPAPLRIRALLAVAAVRVSASAEAIAAARLVRRVA